MRLGDRFCPAFIAGCPFGNTTCCINLLSTELNAIENDFFSMKAITLITSILFTATLSANLILDPGFENGVNDGSNTYVFGTGPTDTWLSRTPTVITDYTDASITFNNTYIWSETADGAPTNATGNFVRPSGGGGHSLFYVLPGSSFSDGDTVRLSFDFSAFTADAYGPGAWFYGVTGAPEITKFSNNLDTTNGSFTLLNTFESPVAIPSLDRGTDFVNTGEMSYTLSGTYDYYVLQFADNFAQGVGLASEGIDMQRWVIDNVVLVPEPRVYALLVGLMAVGLVFLRRRG